MYTLENLYLYYTWKCNLACRHCWVSANDKHRSFLDKEIVNKICIEAVNMGLKHLKFTGGEPLLFAEDILPLATLMKNKYGIAVHLETNGTLITKEIASRIGDAFSSVSISLDSAEEMEHNRQRNNSSCFQRTISGIRYLIEEGIDVSVVSVLSGGSMEEHGEKITGLVNLLKQLGVSYLKLNPVMNVGRASILNAPTYNMSADDILNIQSKYCRKYDNLQVGMIVPCAYQLNIGEMNKSYIHTCHSLSLLSVLPNGDVGLCGEAKEIEAFKFGNIYTQNLKEIWEASTNLKLMREQIDGGKGLVGACRNCVLKEACIGGCRVDGYITGHSVNAAPYICQEMYNCGKFHLSIE